MIAKKLMITFLGIFIALTAYYNVITNSDLKEPFLGTSGVTAISVPQRLNRKRAPCNPCGQNYPTFTVPGTYQSMLSPRFLAEPYSGQVRYNAAPQRYMGVPKNPLGYAESIGHKRPTTRENYSHNTLSSELDAAQTPLPTQSMDTPAPSQDCIMDRFMTATTKSRSYLGNDYIRGSLPVVPVADPSASQLFGKPYQAYQPQSSLVTGALQAIAGITPPVAQFVQQLSQGTMNTNAGGVQAIPSNTSVGQALAMGHSTHLHGQNAIPYNTIAASQF